MKRNSHSPSDSVLQCNSEANPIVSPIFRPFLGTDLQRTWNGLEAKEKRWYFCKVSELLCRDSKISFRKKNFHTTLQLVTHSVATC